MYEEKKHSIYKIQSHPWFQTTVQGLGTCILQIRGEYWMQLYRQPYGTTSTAPLTSTAGLSGGVLCVVAANIRVLDNCAAPFWETWLSWNKVEDMPKVGVHQTVFSESSSVGSRLVPNLTPASQTKAAGQIDLFHRRNELVFQSAVYAVTWQGGVAYQKLSLISSVLWDPKTKALLATRARPSKGNAMGDICEYQGPRHVQKLPSRRCWPSGVQCWESAKGVSAL